MYSVKKKRDFHLRRVIAWEKGVRWLQNSSKFWDQLTGALSYSTQGSPKCRCDGFDGVVITDGECTIVQELEGCETIDEIQIIEIVKPTDGITLMESNIDFPNLMIEPLEMKGSGHFQMRNDENTSDKLYMLYGNPDPSKWQQEASDYRWFHIRGKNF